MKNILMFVALSSTLGFANANAQSQTSGSNDSAINDILSSIERRVNENCQCGGTPEACCSACPDTCKSLNSLGLSMSHDPSNGKWKIQAEKP